MNVTVTARHCRIHDSDRERALSRVGRLSRYEPRMAEGDVIFEEEGAVRCAEVRVRVDGGSIRVARAESDTFRAALDLAVQKITRQLKRKRERRVDHQAPTEKSAEPVRRMTAG
ncbi:MAG: ribosome-associated translation inhibitor RaiA [Gemmatimonadota bacterium]|jgi:ribosomal subunit interface protein